MYKRGLCPLFFIHYLLHSLCRLIIFTVLILLQCDLHYKTIRRQWVVKPLMRTTLNSKLQFGIIYCYNWRMTQNPSTYIAPKHHSIPRSRPIQQLEWKSSRTAQTRLQYFSFRHPWKKRHKWWPKKRFGYCRLLDQTLNKRWSNLRK